MCSSLCHLQIFIRETHLSSGWCHSTGENDDTLVNRLFFKNTNESAKEHVEDNDVDQTDLKVAYFRMVLTPTLLSSEKNTKIWSLASRWWFVKKLSMLRL